MLSTTTIPATTIPADHLELYAAAGSAATSSSAANSVSTEYTRLISSRAVYRPRRLRVTDQASGRIRMGLVAHLTQRQGQLLGVGLDHDSSGWLPKIKKESRETPETASGLLVLVGTAGSEPATSVL